MTPNVPTGPSRRELLLAISGLALLAFPIGCSDSPSTPPGWLTSLRRNVSARAVGEAWLELHPEEGDTATLLDLLGLSTRDDEVQLTKVLRARILEDGRSGHETEVLGWSFTVTEARLFALSATL